MRTTVDRARSIGPAKARRAERGANLEGPTPAAGGVVQAKPPEDLVALQLLTEGRAAAGTEAAAPGRGSTGDRPVRIEHPEQVIPSVNPRSVLNIGGIFGQVTGGQTVLASDGRRFIWSADSLTVIYSLGGDFYIQSGKGFANEVRTAPAIEGARGAEFIAKVGEAEIKLLMGIVAGSSGLGFALVIGTEVAEFVAENYDNFAKWKSQLESVLKAREYLRSVAPTTYDKLFNAVLSQVYQDTKGQLAESITLNTVAFGVGVILGSVGKKLASGKFSLLGLVAVLLEQLAVRFLLNVAPDALKFTAKEYERLAGEIIEKARAAGVSISAGDARKIIEEARQHPQEIKQAYDILQTAFDELKATVAP